MFTARYGLGIYMAQFNLNLLLYASAHLMSALNINVSLTRKTLEKHPIVSLPAPHFYPNPEMPVSFVNSITPFVVYPFLYLLPLAPFIRFLSRLSSDVELKTQHFHDQNSRRHTRARKHTRTHTHTETLPFIIVFLH